MPCQILVDGLGLFLAAFKLMWCNGLWCEAGESGEGERSAGNDLRASVRLSGHIQREIGNE